MVHRNGITPQTLAEAFASRVLRSDGCWTWRGWHNANGYGCVRLHCCGGRSILAHRLSWLVNRGEIPNGLHVLHACDNRGCVRPDHLFLGTNADNIADRVAKGRPGSKAWQGAGERHPNAKLSYADCEEIRALRRSGARCIDLARRFCVTPRHISFVSRGLLRSAS